MPWLFLGGAVLLVMMASGSKAPPRAPSRWRPPSTWPGAKTRLPLGRPGEFFTWAELTRSSTASRLGLDNTPTPEAATRLVLLTRALLDPFRRYLGREIVVHDAYRSAALNAAIPGAAEDSQHMRGEAVDFHVPGMTAREVALALLRSGIDFDQLIWYAPERGGHVHVSWTASRPNRRDTRYAPAGSDREVPWRPA